MHKAKCRPLVKSAQQQTNFVISQPKNMLWVLKRTVSMRYIMGTQKNRLNGTVVLGTQNICFWVRKYL